MPTEPADDMVPVTVTARYPVAEAVRVTTSNGSFVASWCGGAFHSHTRVHSDWVQTPGFNRPAYIGDWIIKTGDYVRVLDDEEFRAQWTVSK